MATRISKAKFFEKIGHIPHEGQKLYHDSSARFKTAAWGRRGGKSLGTARDMEPALFLPDKRYWIIGPTYDLGEKEFRVVWDDLIVGQRLGAHKDVRKGYTIKQGTMYIEFPWRTRLEVRSADHAYTLVGERLDGVIFAEAAKTKEIVWNRYVRPALSDTGGWATFTSTPEGMNWFYDMWKLGQDPERPEYASWRFPSWINTHVFPGGETDPEIELMRASMSEEEFDQEIRALFTAFSGKIFSEFDPELHIQSVEFDPNLPNYIAFDWGFRNPLAAIEFQVTPWDQIRVWREHYKAYLRLEDHLEMLRGRDNPAGYRIDCCFGDPEDPEAIQTVNEKFAPCVGDPMCKTNFREGIDLVKGFLKQYQIGTLDEYGTPKYMTKYIQDYSCKTLEHEFQNYRSASNTPMVARELPQRQNDHGLDALRYALMHIFRLGATRHLTEVISSTVSSIAGATPVGAGTGPGATFFNSGMEF